MLVESKIIQGRNFSWTLRCPTKSDAYELSQLRVKIDEETDYLDREPGEGILSPEDFQSLIHEDTSTDNNLFLIAEVDNKIVGFTRCAGNTLHRFRHKAEFGICILREYWGNGIGRELLSNLLKWTDHAGIEKITLTVVEDNTKAIQLYKQYGFVEEGLLIKDRKHSDGHYYNTVVMGRISSQ
ncbi:GNAT family N-acetyltransferase [Vallitalea okinawensis]|uniref:GNAT family N-acetyltransferase n=1 Tax=Vallitalea okinawensis TaxID=2078660 RepID=UPI000CFE0137|nr:GNAT family N-acetyltransferase [Vallitalea okinawensis]